MNSMQPIKTLVIFALAIGIASCETKDDTDSFITEDVQRYNEKIKEAQRSADTWASDPGTITRQLFGDVGEGTSLSLSVEYKNDDINTAMVTLTAEGLADDSVYGEKRIITFAKKSGVWTIKDIRVGWRCQQGRGHQNYAGKLCS